MKYQLIKSEEKSNDIITQLFLNRGFKTTDIPHYLNTTDEDILNPNLLKNIAIGGALGIFLAAAVILVIYMMDDTVKTSDDIEKYLGLNTLTAIPLREGEKKTRKKAKINLNNIKREKGGNK